MEIIYNSGVKKGYSKLYTKIEKKENRKYQVKCKNCSSVFRYLHKELIDHEYGYDFYSYSIEQVIHCPVCNYMIPHSIFRKRIKEKK